MQRSVVVFASILSISSYGLLSSTSLAQQASPAVEAAAAGGEGEMAQFQFSGMVNADNVYVRSGPSENDYPVIKLNKADVVIAVGSKFDWVKVLPPENTYCLIGKSWVDRRNDGTVGRVREDAKNVANVRVASSLNAMISKVAMQLKPGDDVKILGEQDEYFKIAPPAGTFMYVHKKFVEPLKRVEVINTNGKLEAKPLETPVAAGGTTEGATTPDNSLVLTKSGSGTITLPTDTTAQAATNNGTGPTTAPTVSVASKDEAAFDALETKFDDASKLPLEEQPIDELLATYSQVVADKKIPESMLRIAEFRVKGLGIRRDARDQFLATRKVREELQARTKPTEVEDQEIKQRIEASQTKSFTAVGTLRPSSLPYGGKTLLRLTDPATARTVVYINTDDEKVLRLEGQFIGIRGEVTDDPVRKLKFIVPKEVEQVDPSQIIKGTVNATLLPASLTPQASTSTPNTNP